VVHILKKYYLAGIVIWITSLPLALCQDSEDYLTGFSVEGPFVGVVLIGALLLLLWLIKKYLIKLLLASIVAVTLGGVGYLISSMFLQELAVPLAVGFFILGLVVSLKMPKAKGTSVVRTSLGGSDDEDWSFDDEEDEDYEFDDEEWDWDD